MTTDDAQPDPLDDHAPDWLVELLGEHKQTAAATPFGCFICRCNELEVEQAAIWNNVANGVTHRAHVAAVIWRAITERVGSVTFSMDPRDGQELWNALGADR